MRRVGGAFLAVIGFVGSLVEILGISNSNMQLVTFGFLLVVGLALGGGMLLSWVARARRVTIDGVKELLTGVGKDPSARSLAKRCTVEPATAQDVDWTVGLRAWAYPAGDALPKRLLKEWYRFNPNGFFVIRDENGSRVGHLDLLSLKPGTLDLLLEGEISEKEIRGDSLYRPEERGRIDNLYVEGIIIRVSKGRTGTAPLRCILSNWETITRTVADPENVKAVYAVAASKSGQSLVKGLGFELQQDREKRADKHDLYVARPATISKNIAKYCR